MNNRKKPWDIDSAKKRVRKDKEADVKGAGLSYWAAHDFLVLKKINIKDIK